MTQKCNRNGDGGDGCLEVFLIVMLCLWLTGNCNGRKPPEPPAERIPPAAVHPEDEK